MNKQKIIDLICQQLELDLEALIQSAQATYEAATNEESKPENEYDTRALEASYLAGAQSKRAAEIEENLAFYKQLEIKKFKPTEAISSGALVQVESNQRKFYVLLMPKGGGIILQVDGIPVQVVSPSSPLGEALLGLKVDDTALVETGRQTKEYDILSVE